MKCFSVQKKTDCQCVVDVLKLKMLARNNKSVLVADLVAEEVS